MQTFSCSLVLTVLVLAGCCTIKPTSKDVDPNTATVSEIKHEENATWYKVTWDTGPTTSTLDINTVDWYHSSDPDGDITISNADDTEGFDHYHLDANVSPTTTAFEKSVEVIALSEKEKSWVKSGAIRIMIHNKSGVGSTSANVQPTIISVKAE